IRDRNVTGVQTCALPILRPRRITHSVGVVRDAVIEWVVRRGRMQGDEWSLPVVAETWDGELNDINGFHVTKQDAWAAMDSARGEIGRASCRERGWGEGGE